VTGHHTQIGSVWVWWEPPAWITDGRGQRSYRRAALWHLVREIRQLSWALKIYSTSPSIRGDAHWARPRPQHWRWLEARRKTDRMNEWTKHFHTRNNLSKANIDNASFDICKHWPTDQSECSINEISSAKFRETEHVLNCEIQFRNLFLSKARLFTLVIFLLKELIYSNFEINFEINFQCERGLTAYAFDRILAHNISHICNKITATSQSYGDTQISGGQNSKTPKLTDEKFGVGDYVNSNSPHANIGGISAYVWNITLVWFLVFLSFFVTPNFARILRLNRTTIFMQCASCDDNSGLLHFQKDKNAVSLFPYFYPKTTEKGHEQAF